MWTSRTGHGPISSLSVKPGQAHLSTSSISLYWTHLLPDANVAVAPNIQAGSICTGQATNSGLVCEVDGPQFDSSGRGTQTFYTYDAQGEKLSMTTPKAGIELGGSYQYTYFSDSDTALKGSSNATSAGGWLRAVIDPTGHFVAFGYDAAGNIAFAWDRNSTDGHSQLTYPSPGTDGTAVTLHASALNAAPWRYVLLRSDAENETTTYTVDRDGNHLTTRPPLGTAAGNATHDRTQTFDAYGDVLTSRAPTGDTTTYGYDAFGNRTQATDPLGKIIVDVYDSVNRSARHYWTRGAYPSDPTLVPGGCDQAGQRSDDPAVFGSGASAPMLCRTKSSYDGVDNLITSSDGNAQVTTLSFDAVRREVSTLVPRDTTVSPNVMERTDHVYDAEGHVLIACPPREFTEGAGTCSTSVADNFSMHTTYDYMGRASASTGYRTVGGSALTSTTTYDADGNPRVVTDANGHTTTYTYDLLDRKVSATRQRDATTTSTTSYLYDPVGNTTAVVQPGNPYTGSQADGALVVDGAQYPQSNPLLINSTKNYTNVTLQNGGWISTKPYDFGDGSLQIFASGTVTVCSTCGITATGTGPAGGVGGTPLASAQPGGGVGPGQGGGIGAAAGGGGGGGGNYGGSAAGASSALSGSAGAGGISYGHDHTDLLVPSEALVGAGGGGGGAGAAASGGAGGAGGGFIHISASSIDVEGAIRADGIAGSGGAAVNGSAGGGGGGGGSAGDVWLSAVTVTVGTAGSVSAVGGAGGGSCCEAGGEGGNGIVRLDANTMNGASRVSAGYVSQQQPVRITDYTYYPNNRVKYTIIGADSTNVNETPGTDTGANNVRTEVDYDLDGNVIRQFSARAFLDPNNPYTFMAQTDYDVDGRPTAHYVPRYDNASSYPDESLSPTQSSQCPTSSAYKGYQSTGVCITTISYDAAGNVKQVTLPTATGGNTNRVLNYTYSDDHLLTSVDAPAPPGLSGRVTAMTYSYDGNGKQWLQTDANGLYTRNTFYSDELLRTTTSNPNGSVTHVTSYGYDANGNRTQLTDPLNHGSSVQYTTDNLVADAIDPAGDDSRYAYDNVGNVVSEYSPSAVAGDNSNPFVATSGIGAPTVNTYTYDNLLLTTTQPVVVTSAGAQSQRRTAYTYDLGGRKIEQDVSTVNASGQQTAVGSQEFSYYSDDRLATQNGHDGSVISVQYDPDGNATSVFDSTSQRTVTSTYYLDGLLRSTDEGNPAAADGGRGQRYSYDGLGQIAALRDTLDGSSTVYNTTYAYGDGEQLQSMTSDVQNGGSTTYTYDAGSRLTGENDATGQHAQLSYNADGTLASKVLSQAATTFASWCYSFNGDYQQTQQTFNQSATACSGGTAYNFGYDSASRLNSFQIGAGTVVSIPHDHDGNRLSYIDATGAQTASCYHADDSIDRAIPGTTTPTCAPNAAPAGTQTFSYTGYGQVSGDGVNSFCYDGFDRLSVAVQSTSVTCSSPPASASRYTYDGLDRQISHRDPNASGATAVHYDGLSSSPVFESVFNQPETVYAVDPSGRHTALQSEGNSNSTEYLVDDGFGNIGAVEAAFAPSSPVCGQRYDPFGTPTAAESLRACTTTTSTVNGNTPNSFYFRGGRRDPSTGDYALGSRVYDPSKDSFLSPDSYRSGQPSANLGLGVDPLTANTYAYVNGDPVNLVDPDGHYASRLCDGQTCEGAQGGSSTEPVVQQGPVPTIPAAHHTYYQNADPNGGVGIDDFEARAWTAYALSVCDMSGTIFQSCRTVWSRKDETGGFFSPLCRQGEHTECDVRLQAVYRVTPERGGGLSSECVAGCGPQLIIGIVFSPGEVPLGGSAESIAGLKAAADSIAPESINLADPGVGSFSRTTNSFGQAAPEGESYTYGAFKRANNPGEMAGSRSVRTIDTSTGDTIGWQYETYDAAGNVRIIRPQWGDDQGPHFYYDANGNFTGTR